MGTPTTPDTKTIRVSAKTHKALMDLAERLDGTADDALNHLMGESTVRVPVSDIQRERWADSAHRAGVTLAEFVKLRVEAAIQYGTDPAVMRRTSEMIYRVADKLGVSRQSVDSSTPARIPPAPSVDRTSTERQS